MTTSNELREQAKAKDREAQESFDRCDTDGFLSQWASGISASKLRLQADIEDNGGKWTFPALFDLDGKRVRAKLGERYNKFAYGYESVWIFYDEHDRPIRGKFPIHAFPKRESTMTKKGYREGTETVPAYADIKGRGYGLSGTCWVAACRKDNGYPADAIVG